jgi:hypothetical protein
LRHVCARNFIGKAVYRALLMQRVNFQKHLWNRCFHEVVKIRNAAVVAAHRLIDAVPCPRSLAHKNLCRSGVIHASLSGKAVFFVAL